MMQGMVLCAENGAWCRLHAQGGALDGMVWMGGEEEDEEQELVQFYEQGRITEDQLGRIRRNSACRGEGGGGGGGEGGGAGWSVREVVERLSPARSKLALMGSLRRRGKREDRSRAVQGLSMESPQEALATTSTSTSREGVEEVEEVPLVTVPPKTRIKSVKGGEGEVGRLVRGEDGGTGRTGRVDEVCSSSSLYSIPRQLVPTQVYFRKSKIIVPPGPRAARCRSPAR